MEAPSFDVVFATVLKVLVSIFLLSVLAGACVGAVALVLAVAGAR